MLFFNYFSTIQKLFLVKCFFYFTESHLFEALLKNIFKIFLQVLDTNDFNYSFCFLLFSLLNMHYYKEVIHEMEVLH